MAQRNLRDMSGTLGGMAGGAAKALRNRQAQLDDAIGAATAKKATAQPAKKKRRTNSPYGGMYE